METSVGARLRMVVVRVFQYSSAQRAAVVSFASSSSLLWQIVRP